MEYRKLQQKLFDLDPSDRAEDLRRLSESVGQPQKNVAEAVDYVQESVKVQEGTMPVEGDYSLSDFAALAGVAINEGERFDRLKKAAAHGWKNYNTIDMVRPNKGKDLFNPKDDPKDDPKANKKYVSPSKQKNKVSEGPLVINGESQLIDMIQTLLGNWVQNDHTDKEYADLLSAIGYKMQKDGDRTVLVREGGASYHPVDVTRKRARMAKKRNPVASHAQSSGSGVHKDQFNKNKPDRKQKHKKPIVDESIKAQLWAKLNAKK